ncbi:hypothetical protein FN846DRAFT_892298 [Sphaerosporella brunnea]|uniref:Uncharacterized protein n=1 Tax=Sphaerosporella brunnea TaxID=1250544 RepID=A0A5J5ERS1_9PEZI|nr:hypothetical protein FN846DRAFT_892298 [Sphaerosporella brunnea]
MADSGWVDDLDEDWVSQPRSSSPNPSPAHTLGTNPGTTRVLHERHYTNSSTHRHSSRHSDTLGSQSFGTTQLHTNLASVDTPEWKRKLRQDLGGVHGKDLFSPLELENLFRPPSTANPPPSPPTSLPPPRERQHQPPPHASRSPRSPRRGFHLPILISSGFPSPLSTLPEEATSGSPAEPVKPLVAPCASQEDPKPVLRPLNRHSMLAHPNRYLPASPPEEPYSPPAGRHSELSKGKRREAGTTEGRLKKLPMARPGTKWLRKSSPPRQSSDDRRDEMISPVSVGDVGRDSPMKNIPILRRGESNPESARTPYARRRYGGDEEEETLPPDVSASVRRFMRPDLESSVYPSSPPVFRGQYPQGRDYEEDMYEEEEEQLEEGDYEDYSVDHTRSPLRRPPPTPPSPDRRPSIDRHSSAEDKPVKKADISMSDLLRNIRNHADAPRSPVKRSNSHNEVPKLSDGEDPFFAPHVLRHPSESETPPSEEQRAKDLVSPLKLFSGCYDTYTKEKLRKRLGELEESEEDQPSPNRTIDFDREGESDADDESEHQYSGASPVVDRLEAMARKIEKQDSPPAGKTYARKSRVMRYGETEKTTTTTSKKYVNGHQRMLSAPSASPIRPASIASGRKHRRWRSDESSVAPNDGVAAPRSPVKERTPKRPRRSTVTSRPGSSHLFQGGPATGRKRIYAGIEEGSILASSRRQQRSRANSKDSQFSAKKSHTSNAASDAVEKASPPPTPRKKKQHFLRDAGAQPVIVPPKNGVHARGPRKIIFSGSKGDGMQGESFEMPSPSRDANLGNRRGSVNTRDFLAQAEAVMARLRALGLKEDDKETEEEAGSTGSSSRGSSDEGGESAYPSASAASREDYCFTEEDPGSTSMRLQAVADKLNGCQGRFPTSMDGDDQRREGMGISRSSTKSSRSSVRVISNDPEVLTHHLATKHANDMTFDQANLAWVSKAPNKGEDDPLRDISDLTVDSKEEARILGLAKAQWSMLASSPGGAERSGMWRSSRVVEEIDMRELRTSCCAGNETWDKSQWGRSQALGSSVGSDSSRESEYDARGTETRPTSYGTDDTAEKNVRETEMRNDHEDDDRHDKPAKVKKPPTKHTTDDAFASSPLKREVRLDDDDENFDGFLEHGSLRRRNGASFGGLYRGPTRRKSLGKSFLGRPISRITEEEEGSHKSRRSDEFRRSLSSALTPIQSPFRSYASLLPPPSAKNKGDVSFYLSPLPDLSYRFETTEALISLELSYITSRRGLKPTSTKAVEASFTIAQQNLVKHLTDVEPYDPYWDFIKCLKLSERKLETLHSLNEWCPRISELDVSNNLLGQLSGVPESVLSLNVQRNCLSNVTFFGHLMNLQYLDISGNGLESLEALRVCQHLREIKADDNMLTSIDGVFSISGLMSLRCRRNRLETVDLSYAELKRLTELDLRGNQIALITGIECLPSLVHLNLDQNRLLSLPLTPGTKLESIRSLKLTQNRFTTFDVTPFPNLRVFYMDNNRLSHVGGLTRAKSLDAVSFRDQETESGTFDLDVPRMFEARKVYLSANPIGTLDLHASFLNLHFLELAGAHLRSLPKDIANQIPNVRVLNLNSNALSDLRPLAGLSRLVKLCAAGNRINNIKRLQRTLSKLRGIKIVDFRNNPVTLGFYPPITTVVKSVVGNEEYAKDPYEVGEADVDNDEAHVPRLDLGTRCERRRYWLVVGGACKKIKEVDGLPFDRDGIEREDEVWMECLKRGWVVEAGGDR